VEKLAPPSVIQGRLEANAIGEGVHFVPTRSLPDAFQVAQVAGNGTRPDPPASAGVRPWPPNADADSWTRGPFEDGDPMPDYESLLTD